MKYLIVKGCLGFGDRLESLKMAVKYALLHNLQIYVDWRDPTWSHGTEDFYTYFKLINMPVLEKLEDIPEDATYHPPFWKNNLDKHLSEEFAQEHEKDVYLDIIKNQTFDADVIVYSSITDRMLYVDSRFFANVFRVIDPRIINQVKYHLSQYPVDKSWGIHIRGTDRLKSNRRTLSVQSIVSNVTSMGGMNQPHFVAVSDDKENLEIWKRYYSQTYVASNLAIQQQSVTGNHKLHKSKLVGTKDEMNVDMLIDFCVLTKCNRVFTTVKDSRYAQEARRLHPVIDTILGL